MDDDTWKAASAAIRQAWTNEVAAENEGIKGGMKKLPAAQELHEAQRQIAQAQTILRTLGAGPAPGRPVPPATPVSSPGR